jgi:hypothetical protein
MKFFFIYKKPAFLFNFCSIFVKMIQKAQLDNLIDISIFFHRSMDMEIEFQSPDYILEKWEKYIGFLPQCDEKPVGGIELSWVSRWGVDEGDWKKLGKAFRFFLEVNKKAFAVSSDKFSVWSPSLLIDLFEEMIGSVELINKDYYNSGLHELVRKKRDYWIWQNDFGRDYKLNLLV